MSMSGSKYTSNGAVGGDGIYMAKNPFQALTYAHPGTRGNGGSTAAASASNVAKAANAASMVAAANNSSSPGSTFPSADPAAVGAKGGSLWTQGCVAGGGVGNGTNLSTADGSEAPAIVAVCEIINRPGHQHNSKGHYVISDESCVAIRFLLNNVTKPKMQRYFAGDGGGFDLAAAAARQYSTIKYGLK